MTIYEVFVIREEWENLAAAYTTKEEAEKARDYIESLPWSMSGDDVTVVDIEVSEKFTPFFSQKDIEQALEWERKYTNLIKKNENEEESYRLRY